METFVYFENVSFVAWYLYVTYEKPMFCLKYCSKYKKNVIWIFYIFYQKYFKKTLRGIFIFLEAHVTIVQDFVTEKKSLYKGF